MAQREIGLAAGEPPSQKGYTPSVFNLLPKIFERAGNFETGSITGFFTVLVEGDDFNEPVCDAVRGILDGHITLSRELGAAGHYPAVDVLHSVSRVMNHIVKPDQVRASQAIREALACLHRSADLLQLGAYVSGTNPKLDTTLRCRDRLFTFLKQEAHHKSPIQETVQQLCAIAAELS
jgi:flagellar biosynthesis/type III secretory pathway ATPase